MGNHPVAAIVCLEMLFFDYTQGFVVLQHSFQACGSRATEKKHEDETIVAQMAQ
jgi:hypothetical protein